MVSLSRRPLFSMRVVAQRLSTAQRNNASRLLSGYTIGGKPENNGACFQQPSRGKSCNTPLKMLTIEIVFRRSWTAAVNTCTPLTCVQDVGVISIDRGNNAEAEELRNHAIRKHRVDGLLLNVYSQPRGS